MVRPLHQSHFLLSQRVFQTFSEFVPFPFFFFFSTAACLGRSKASTLLLTFASVLSVLFLFINSGNAAFFEEDELLGVVLLISVVKTSLSCRRTSFADIDLLCKERAISLQGFFAIQNQGLKQNESLLRLGGLPVRLVATERPVRFVAKRKKSVAKLWGFPFDEPPF